MSDLCALELSTLLRLIEAIAKQCAVAGWGTPGNSKREVISLAARTLRDWPSNFIALLKDFAQKEFSPQKKVAVSKSKEIYRPLFTDFGSGEHKKDTDFILSVLIEYAANEWDYRDAFQMKRFQDRLPTGLLSSKEFAHQLAGATSVPCRHPVRPRNEPESENVMAKWEVSPELDPRDAISHNLASARLGISPVLFRAIVGGGLCKTHRLASGKETLSQRDIESFKQRFLNLAPVDNCNLTVGQCISLQAALSWKWDSLETKLELLRALLDRRIEIAASFGDAIGNLQMDRTAYLSFVGAVRKRSAQESMSATEAAKALDCERALIPGLVRTGALHGSTLPTGLRIDRASIESFTRNYVFMMRVAKTLRTNTMKLARYCDRIGIAVTWPSRGTRHRVQAYIRSEDAQRVIERVRAERDAKQAKVLQEKAELSATSINAPRFSKMTFDGVRFRREIAARAHSAIDAAHLAGGAA